MEGVQLRGGRIEPVAGQQVAVVEQSVQLGPRPRARLALPVLDEAVALGLACVSTSKSVFFSFGLVNGPGLG